MELRETGKRGERRRFERFNIVFPILLAGWVPSILTLVVSYTILSKTLESKILTDRQSLVQVIGRLVGDDLARTSGIIDYYQNSPDAAQLLSGASNPAATQQWLSSAFYSHPRIDGMFLTSADGRLVASVPPDPGMTGKDYGTEFWREEATRSNQPYVSPIHPRFSDKRMVTDIVGSVRAPNGAVIGYLGVSVLVERIGRRLSTTEFVDESQCQILDQNGTPLFTKNFVTNESPVSPEGKNLINEIGRNKSGHVERDGNLYSFSPVESTGWMTVVEQPRAVAYKPVRDLVGRLAVPTIWLMGLVLALALLFGRFYRRQTESARRLEREVVFNEKILANMPIGIAFVDPDSMRFLQANEAFAQMARRLGGLAANAEVTEANYDQVKIAPPGAIERVLSFGTPFQLIEQPFKDEGGNDSFRQRSPSAPARLAGKGAGRSIFGGGQDSRRDATPGIDRGQCGQRSIPRTFVP